MANREIRKSRIAGSREKSPSGDVGKAMRQGSTGTGTRRDVGAEMRQGSTGTGRPGHIEDMMKQRGGHAYGSKKGPNIKGRILGSHNRAQGSGKGI